MYLNRVLRSAIDAFLSQIHAWTRQALTQAKLSANLSLLLILRIRFASGTTAAATWFTCLQVSTPRPGSSCVSECPLLLWMYTLEIWLAVLRNQSVSDSCPYTRKWPQIKRKKKVRSSDFLD